jgi:hypothetical protein
MTLGLYARALRSKRRRPHAERAPMGTEAPTEYVEAVIEEAA